ncbi:MAG: YggT family protein [Paracoccaceae bacterium]
MASFLTLFNFAVHIAWWIIIIQFIMSWLISFDVINTRNPLVSQVWYALNRITAPVYRPIRRILPDMGGLDFSPVVVLFGLYALQVVVNNNLAPLAYGR